MNVLLPAPPWPHAGVAAAAMLLLAAIDLTATYATKEAVLRHSPAWGAAAAALAVALFWVYASALQYAELTLVTLGWVVALQVGVVLLDRFRYGQTIAAGQWAAVAVIIAAQGYLLAAPTTGRTPS